MLVVDDKWLAALDATIHGEMDRVSQALTQRVKELAERYETPLPQMGSRAAELEAKVNRHLEKMGFSWKNSVRRGPLHNRRSLPNPADCQEPAEERRPPPHKRWNTRPACTG